MHKLIGHINLAIILHQNCLYGTVKRTRNSIRNRYIQNGWGIAFNGASSSSFDNHFVRNAIIFGVDGTSSIHTNSHKNNFLVLGEGHNDDSDDSAGTVVKINSINFIKTNIKFFFNFH